MRNELSADDLVESILVKYSSPSCDKTHCSKSDIKRDFVNLVSAIMRSEKDAIETHENWMRWQRMMAEDRKPFLQKLFFRN